MTSVEKLLKRMYLLNDKLKRSIDKHGTTQFEKDIISLLSDDFKHLDMYLKEK